MSRPRKSTSPSRLAPSGRSPMRPRPRVDFPQPDSPTRPRVSPGARSKLTPSTARMAPLVVPYQTLTSRAEITGSWAGTPTDSSSRSMDTSVLPLPGRGPALTRRQDDGQQPATPQGRVESLVEALTHQRQRGHQQDDSQA